ncbi:glycosyltransferase [Candidatus Uabimicrobium amorphum]|uniref:Glycosyl transferase n=1 Tax=Uabimicrobium amorphum TaxID=2596890 RepID=A0A5S9IHT9_UABAM|nr:glycosyltransferase [Candidatus Uabimicrobium amorphum]BBM82079.1 glycosyl transferase [Candidatus Uabimicrobium amorphum]
MKILFTVIAAAGHIHPTLPIAQQLQRRGHEVVYATGGDMVHTLENLGFHAIALLLGEVDSPEQMNEPIHKHHGRRNPYSLYIEFRYLFSVIYRARLELEKHITNWRPDLIITDFSTPVGASLGTVHDIPWITTTTVPACIRTYDGTPAFLGGWGISRHFLHRWRNRLGVYACEVFRHGVDWLFSKELRKLGLKLNLPSRHDGLYSPFAILGLSIWEFEYARSWPKHFHMLGPLDYQHSPLSLSEDCLDFLHTTTPKIFVTLGTHLGNIKRQFVPRMIRHFGTLPFRFVISLGGHQLNDFPPLPGNVKVVDYIAYDQILEKVDVVIHHGGMGIIYHAIAKGCPAITVPQGYDQFDNAQRIADLGIGLRITNRQLLGRRLHRCISTILDDERYRSRTAQLAKVMANNYQPTANAVAVIEKVLSTSSPVCRDKAPYVTLDDFVS